MTSEETPKQLGTVYNKENIERYLKNALLKVRCSVCQEVSLFNLDGFDRHGKRRFKCKKSGHTLGINAFIEKLNLLEETPSDIPKKRLNEEEAQVASKRLTQDFGISSFEPPNDSQSEVNEVFESSQIEVDLTQNEKSALCAVLNEGNPKAQDNPPSIYERLLEQLTNLTKQVEDLKKEVNQLKAENEILKNESRPKPSKAPEVREIINVQDAEMTDKNTQRTQSSTQNRASFAEIVSKYSDDKQNGIKELLKNSRRFTKTIPKARFDAEEKNKMRLIYISGLNFLPLSQVRKILYNSRFLMSKIHNLAWVGRIYLEVLVDDDYASTFEKKIKETEVLEIHEKLDPRKHLKDPSPEMTKIVEESFAIRVAKIMSYNRRENVRKFFSELCEQSSVNIKNKLRIETERIQKEKENQAFEVDMDDHNE